MSEPVRKWFNDSAKRINESADHISVEELHKEFLKWFEEHKDEINEAVNLQRLLEENRKMNQNRHELTLEEINAEIAAARAERKAKME